MTRTPPASEAVTSLVDMFAHVGEDIFTAFLHHCREPLMLSVRPLYLSSTCRLARTTCRPLTADGTTHPGMADIGRLAPVRPVPDLGAGPAGAATPPATRQSGGAGTDSHKEKSHGQHP